MVGFFKYSFFICLFAVVGCLFCCCCVCLFCFGCCCLFVCLFVDFWGVGFVLLSLRRGVCGL